MIIMNKIIYEEINYFKKSCNKKLIIKDLNSFGIFKEKEEFKIKLVRKEINLIILEVNETIESIISNNQEVII